MKRVVVSKEAMIFGRSPGEHGQSYTRPVNDLIRNPVPREGRVADSGRAMSEENMYGGPRF